QTAPAAAPEASMTAASIGSSASSGEGADEAIARRRPPRRWLSSAGSGWPGAARAPGAALGTGALRSPIATSMPRGGIDCTFSRGWKTAKNGHPRHPCVAAGTSQRGCQHAGSPTAHVVVLPAGVMRERRGQGAPGPPGVLTRSLAAALDASGAPRAGAHLLVAVSGGPDSTALLAALAELAPTHDLRLTAVHVDHGLRGAAGAAESARVAALAAARGVGFVAERLALTPGADLAARARRARYRGLLAAAARVGAQHVVTAH